MRPTLLDFARARRVEADLGRIDLSPVEEPKLTEPEINALLGGFMTIRDSEHLDDVADWANAVIALLEDETGLRRRDLTTRPCGRIVTEVVAKDIWPLRSVPREPHDPMEVHRS